MARRFSIQLAIFLCTVVFLAGCLGQSAPINVKSIKTVVNEDGSGSNSFRLAMPLKENCTLQNFRPELDAFKDRANGSSERVTVSKFRDGADAGWDVTIKFDYPEQIPEQIEGLKRSIVTTLKNNATGYIQPEWDRYIETNDKEFSVNVGHPASKEQGKEWNILITISPVLLTAPEAACSYPEIEYEIVMPGKINSFKTSIVAYSGIFGGIIQKTMGGASEQKLLDYAPIEKTQSNTLLWKIRPKSIGELFLEEDDIDYIKLSQTTGSKISESQLGKMLYDHLQSNEEDRAAVEQLLGMPLSGPEDAIVLLFIKPIYSINVNSATPMSPTQFIVSNITPIVLLFATILGIILTLLNIRQVNAKRKEKP